jgi:hypothetical protein
MRMTCHFRDVLIKQFVHFTASKTACHFIKIDPEMEIPLSQILIEGTKVPFKSPTAERGSFCVSDLVGIKPTPPPRNIVNLM